MNALLIYIRVYSELKYTQCRSFLIGPFSVQHFNSEGIWKVIYFFCGVTRMHARAPPGRLKKCVIDLDSAASAPWSPDWIQMCLRGCFRAPETTHTHARSRRCTARACYGTWSGLLLALWSGFLVLEIEPLKLLNTRLEEIKQMNAQFNLMRWPQIPEIHASLFPVSLMDNDDSGKRNLFPTLKSNPSEVFFWTRIDQLIIIYSCFKLTLKKFLKKRARCAIIRFRGDVAGDGASSHNSSPWNPCRTSDVALTDSRGPD